MPAHSKAKKILAWTIIGLLLPLLAARLFIGYYRIPQNGMYPGLPAGSIIFTLKRAYTRPADVRHGDIVVFERELKGQRYSFIWRVVGLPGEKVEASGASLRINGQALKRERLREAGDRTIYRERNGSASYEVALETPPRHRPPDVSITVPPDQFFVMGDNRFTAVDSRYLGPVPFRSILGRKL